MGVKIWSLCSVSNTLSHANLEQPFRTLAIKWEVNIFVKKSSCVFLSASLSCVVYSCVCLWYCVVVMLNDDVDDDTTIPFPRVLVLCEMQSVSSRIWTRVAGSISYDVNHYTTVMSSISAIHRTLSDNYMKSLIYSIYEYSIPIVFLTLTGHTWYPPLTTSWGLCGRFYIYI